MFPTFPPRKLFRPMPPPPTQNAMRRELAILCGGTGVSTTGPTTGRSIYVYGEGGIVREFHGLFGRDKMVLQAAIDIMIKELSIPSPSRE